MAAVVITKNYRNCNQELGYINIYSLGQKQQTDYLQSHSETTDILLTKSPVAWFKHGKSSI